MWAITSTNFAGNFRHGRVPVFLFLCDGYQTAALRWLVQNWHAIHANAGPRWHMLVPTIRPINDDPRLATTENYDIGLALDLAENYGLSTLRDPVLVLDNLDDSRRQLVLKIPAREDDIRALMQDISQLSRNPPEGMNRSQLTDWIYDELRKKMLFRALVTLAPKAASGLVRLIPKPA